MKAEKQYDDAFQYTVEWTFCISTLHLKIGFVNS
jgi:hypothetical protein